MFAARLTTLALATLAVTGLAARPAAAQSTITAVSYNSAAFDTYNAQFSLGYSFTTGANALDVTALGYLNDGQTGSNATHQVEIYQITNGGVLNPMSGTALFAPISVTTGAASAAYNTFSYTTLTTPVLLNANTAYEIVANNNGNGYGIMAQNPVYSGIIYGTSTYSVNQTMPVFNGNPYGYNDVGNFGPNFTASIVSPSIVSAAPEPSQFAVLGFAVLGVGGLVLKARRKTAMAAA